MTRLTAERVRRDVEIVARAWTSGDIEASPRLARFMTPHFGYTDEIRGCVGTATGCGAELPSFETNRRDLLREVMTGTRAGDVAIRAITLAELLAGVSRLPDGRRKTALRAGIDAAVQPYRETRSVLAFDDAAAAHYAAVLTACERAGLSISTADAQIAAICRTHIAACATRNTKDFTQTGVEVIDPWDD